MQKVWPISNGDGTFRIPMPRGLFAVVDDGDVEKVAQHNWRLLSSKKSLTFYASAVNPFKGPVWTMHRLILCFPVMDVDHINGNGLDNRRCNLRLATKRQNSLNHRKRPNGTSRYRGVFFRSDSGKWDGSLRVDGRLIRLGSYVREEDAAAAYDVAATVFNGRFARLNQVHVSDQIRKRVLEIVDRKRSAATE